MAVSAITIPLETSVGPVIVTVGPEGGDVRGGDSAAIQSAADEVARRAPGGGGLLLIKAGTYTMHDSLHIRCPMTVRGEGAKTVLLKAPQVRTDVLEDWDLSECAVAVADSAGLRAGMGVTVLDKNQHRGWAVSVRTILEVDGRKVRLDRRPERDYSAAAGCWMQNSHPLISTRGVDGVTIEDLVVDGNLERNRDIPLDGCRGGGVYFHDVKRCVVRRVLVRNVNGDGISWQTTEDMLVEDCESSGNGQRGFHPGTGSPRTTVRNCRGHHNGFHGLYICWGVRHSRFENCCFDDNGWFGVSVGHKDTDNVLADCTMRRNGVGGMLFRPKTEANSAHRVSLVRCLIEDNGGSDVAAPGQHDWPCAGIKIHPHAAGTLLEGCTIRDTRPPAARTQGVAIWYAPGALPVTMGGGNTIDGEIIKNA